MFLLRYRVVHAQSVDHSLLLVAYTENVQKFEIHAMRRYCLSRPRSDRLCLPRPLYLFPCSLQLVAGL